MLSELNPDNDNPTGDDNASPNTSPVPRGVARSSEHVRRRRGRRRELPAALAPGPEIRACVPTAPLTTSRILSNGGPPQIKIKIFLQPF